MFKQHIKTVILSTLLGVIGLYANEISQQQKFQKIAASYLKYSAIHNFPEWKASKITKLTPFYSSNGYLLAYEASITPTLNKQIQKQGYLFINVPKDKPLISTLSTTGESISKILKTYWENTYADQVIAAGLKILDFKFLISPPSGYAIGVKLNGEAPFLEEANLQDGYYIFTPFSSAKNLKYTYHTHKQSRTLKKNSHERSLFEKALLTEDFDTFFFQTVEKGEISIKKRTRDAKTISATFASYYQEKRYWNNDPIESLAGCVPVAWSILYEYWDERGYGKLIGSAAFNSFYNVTDSHVREMISYLRESMHAEIEDTRQTGVSEKNVVLGISYAHYRGYPSFSAYTDTYNKGWSSLKKAISNRTPPIAAYFTTTGKHGAVAYKYIDNYGSQNDLFCVRTGWRDITSECKNVEYLIQTTIVNPNGNQTPPDNRSNIKYGAVAVSIAKNYTIVVGAHWNTTSKQEALNKAMANCQKQASTGCYTLKVVENSCIALAQIPNQNKGSIAAYPSIDQAQQSALYKCNQRTSNRDCFIKLAFCSNEYGSKTQEDSKNQTQNPKKQEITPPSHHNTYSAIAIAVNNGRLIRWGKSWKKSSLYDAKQAALKGCAHSGCKVIVTGKNQCISLAKIKYKDKGTYQKANNYYEAQRGALSRCKNRRNGECFTVTTVCSNGSH